MKILVEGDYACFTRPEFKAERMTYDVITPSAAIGLLKSIYWHPGMDYYIKKIYVLNPIKYGNIKRNEIKSKINNSKILPLLNGEKKAPRLYRDNDIAQRNTCYLKDVKYIIDADFYLTTKMNPTDNEKKFFNIIMKRLKKGQFFTQPYLGCREFTARVSLYDKDIRNEKLAYQNETKELGYMLYKLDYTNLKNIKPIFYRCVIKNGVINVDQDNQTTKNYGPQINTKTLLIKE